MNAPFEILMANAAFISDDFDVKSVNEYLSLWDVSNEDKIQFVSTLNSLVDAHSHFVQVAKEQKHQTTEVTPEADAIVLRLMQQKTTAQRTLAWYKQGQEVLTASQFATLTKSPRTRGQLVLEKAKQLTEADISVKPLCCHTFGMRAFDWGIRFEPIAKLLYQSITNTTVADLGRLMHPVLKSLAASPDGLVVSDTPGSIGSRKGRLVEYKAPISRVITEEVPKDYYVQMQIQMEVADVELCDYFEITCISPGVKNYVEPAPTLITKGHGNIFLIGLHERPSHYEYSPLNNKEWTPDLKENECILETIPWWCTGYNLKTIERSKEWFEKMVPLMNAFWEDVEKAKKGEFVLVETSRKRKLDSCKIVDEEEMAQTPL